MVSTIAEPRGTHDGIHLRGGDVAGAMFGDAGDDMPCLILSPLVGFEMAADRGNGRGDVAAKGGGWGWGWAVGKWRSSSLKLMPKIGG
ncbi:hypothetical protein AAC387_Pa09g0724 [Persea americana]